MVVKGLERPVAAGSEAGVEKHREQEVVAGPAKLVLVELWVEVREHIGQGVAEVGEPV